MNYVTYITCMSIELVLIVIHISVMAEECGNYCGEGSIITWYVLYGVLAGLKLIANMVGAWNMIVFAEEMTDRRLLSTKGY